MHGFDLVRAKWVRKSRCRELGKDASKMHTTWMDKTSAEDQNELEVAESLKCNVIKAEVPKDNQCFLYTRLQQAMQNVFTSTSNNGT